MNEGLMLPSEIFSVFSIIANIYLLYLYYACPVKAIKAYKTFFFITAIQNLLFSLCEILLIPVLVSSDFAMTFAATGSLRKHFGGQLLMIIFVLAFGSSISIATNTFVYRYIQMCKYRLFEIYVSTYGVLIVLLTNTAMLAIFLATIYEGFWPTLLSVQPLREIFLSETGLDLSECAQLTFSLKISLLNPISLGLLGVSLTLISLMAGITVYCAGQISSTLNKSTLSRNSRKMQRRMFTLLVLQIICPLTFLHMPVLIAYIAVFTGYSTTILITSAISVLLSIYPLTSPIVIVGFLNDYRNYTLGMLCRMKRKLPTQSRITTVSEFRITPVTNQTI